MTRIRKLKIKAGALQYVLFIGVVIVLLVFAFILLSYTQKQFRLLNSQYIESVKKTDALIVNLNENAVPDSQTMDPQLQETSVVSIKPWGLFQVAMATTGFRNQKFTKLALIGGHAANRNSLYLQDNNQPLVVVGNTRIEGRISLPKQGIKRGSIAGNSYTGSELYYGYTQPSTQQLPKFLGLDQLQQDIFAGPLNSTELSFDLAPDLELINSFNEPTKAFRTEGLIELSNVTLRGNILIQSSVGITLDASSELADVLLIAPKVTIANNVKGNFQVLATDEIRVGSGCELNYPSALAIYQKPGVVEPSNQPANQRSAALTIGTKSEIRGLVAFFSEQAQAPYETQVLLEDESTVVGEVYCRGNLELLGTVKGGVITEGFMANQFGNLYKNHIYNGKILTSQFPEQYVGLLLETYQKKVAKWLY